MEVLARLIHLDLLLNSLNLANIYVGIPEPFELHHFSIIVVVRILHLNLHIWIQFLLLLLLCELLLKSFLVQFLSLLGNFLVIANLSILQFHLLTDPHDVEKGPILVFSCPRVFLLLIFSLLRRAALHV